MIHEEAFVTEDMGLTFKVVEGEDGDVFWGYGHVPVEEFIAEVSRWLNHVGEPEVWPPDDGSRVEHLWAKMSPDGELFDYCTARDLQVGEIMFAVTRLVLK